MSSVSSIRDAPVVVPVSSKKSPRIPVSRSSRISAVQLYLPICNNGGPLLILGKLITVGVALGLADEDEEIKLTDVTSEGPVDAVAD
jgi:hypothetical protein